MVNCPNCGTSNLDNATVCVNCGRSLSGGAAGAYTPPPASSPGGFATATPVPPPNTSVIVYLILSILQLLCCCNPVAVVPLVFAIMSISRRNAGDYAGAALNSSRAAMWFWIALVIAILGSIAFFMFFGGAAILEEMRRNLGQ